MRQNNAAIELTEAMLDFGAPAAAIAVNTAVACPTCVPTSRSDPSRISERDADPVLRKLEGFVSLDDDDRALVQTLTASGRMVPAKTDLIREDESSAYVRFVISGFAYRYKRLAGGKRQIVAFLIPGDFCDLQLPSQHTMDHGIATLVRSCVAEVSRETIHSLLRRPNLAGAMAMSTLVDLATLREWVTNIGQRPAEYRIAHLFCELHSRLATIGAASDGVLALPINQTDLSDAVGLSLVHTNKTLKALRNRKLLTFAGGMLTILDLPRLEELCGFKPNYLRLGPSLM